MKDITYELREIANELNRYGEFITRADWQTLDGNFHCIKIYCYNDIFYTVTFINGTVTSISIRGNKNES